MHQHTILLTLMGLDIGGAETHVVTLSKHLKDLGYNVIAASNGGIYEKELSDYGIKHYKVSLNTKNPFVVIKSFLKLISIVKTEKVELIHAHARIPAFISNIVSKIFNIKFMTTAHAKFRSNFILKYLSVWGQKTIAISQDIKDHLINAFNVTEDQIEIITNGIDTDIFNSNANYDDLFEEFGIDSSYKRIVWVSRIDSALSKTISELINSASTISKSFEKVSIFIVGSGDNLEKIRQRAEDTNEKIGKQLIKVVGSRTDINKILNFCDVFVGISRSALEAMSCEKPVILAGPWSFVGMFDENLLDICIEDNFTGRSSSQPVISDLLQSSITNVLNMSYEKRNKLGNFGRNVILKNYSSLNMTKSTAQIYQNIFNGGDK